ncbi:MAG: hypothetical protein IKE27_05855 [Oscillospiraceae bacterium]|nr:hypothetical protein [Oscillospiraceae bacterium]
MDNKNNVQVDPFINWAHTFGRIFSLIIVVYMFAMPTIYCAINNCFPSFKEVLTGALPLVSLFWPIAFSEAISYPPILGSSSYLSFITGNVMNLKLPCAINAQKLTNATPNTPEGDAVALLANSISSITTMAIIVLGMFLMIPLQPVLQSPAVQTATKYMLPAMFGCLMLGFIMTNKEGTWIKNKLLIPLPAAIISLILYFTWSRASMYQGVIVILSIVLCIAVARVLWSKGIVKVVKGPNGDPVE